MYINKLDEIIKEFQDYEYYDNEELEEDISKIKYILLVLEKKGVCFDILNYEEE
jgi:hypothetical protein